MTEAENRNQLVDLEFDIGNLSVYNSQHVDYPSEPAAFEKKIQDLALENYRMILGRLLELRGKEDETRDAKKLDLQIHDFDKSEYHINLPEGVTLFPRFNPMPSKKDLTKWEKFAQEKGIKKKSKTMKVFDEATQTWVMRHGTGGAKQMSKQRDVVRELKPGQLLTHDAFEEEREKKKSDKQKQQISEIKNRMRAKGHDESKAQTHDERMNKINMKKDRLRKIKQAKKEKLAANLRIAQSSTASMGKFDKKVSKDEVQKKIGKKRQKIAMNFDSKKEVERNKELLSLIGR